jgi:osmotically-inducible protein OsmY
MNAERVMVESANGRGHERTDEEIVRSALHALDEETSVPAGSVQVLSCRGDVRLSGEVDWNYQRDAAIAVVRNVPGVNAVVSTISLAPYEYPERLKARVTWALGCSPNLDVRNVAVDYVGGRIVLRGWTPTRRERDEAERLACAMPGVVAVENDLEIGPRASPPALDIPAMA